MNLAEKEPQTGQALAGRGQMAFYYRRYRRHWGLAGNTILRANMLSMAAGRLQARWAGLPAFWRAQIAGWTLFGILDLLNRQLAYRDFAVALVLTLIVTLCLAGLSSMMRAVYASHPIDNRLTRRVLVLIALLSLAAASTVALIIFTLRQMLDWTIPHWGPVEEIVIPLIHYFLALSAWSLCYFWAKTALAEQAERRHAMRAEAEALRAELEELRLQLDPHFLFNALNGVAEEVPEHPDAALAMLRNLTAYLRHSLDSINQTVVTVSFEVGGLSAYLAVQKARFGERLKSTVDVTPQAAQRRIASFLLQPLVENAVKHGRREHGLEVRVDIRAEGEALHVLVENTGTLAEDNGSRPRRPGLGLENVRRRLALHYPQRHKFTLGSTHNSVIAALVLEGEPCSGS
ncbi:MAG: histidine kinase [Xanthobacteraceae bacterium]|nr:histidine kinase [Xanthobacteraceae bacterium]